MKKFSKFVAMLLSLSIAATSVVWADTGQDIDVSGLRVSDAFAAQYPHGMFEVLSPYIITGEGKEFDFYVLRRGGTEGEASVNIKEIGISAKYGEDFVFREKDALGFYHDLKKNKDNPSLLESQIEQNKDILFTTDRLASDVGIDVYTFDDVTSENAVDATEEADVRDADKSISIDEALQQEKAPAEASYSDDMGGYTSSLHKMRDEATGVVTPEVSDSASYSLEETFKIKNEERVKLMNDAAESFEGLEYTLDFKDGQAYKIIHVKITDDDIYEAQEAFTLALYNATNGACIGEQSTSDVIIDDDENIERSKISFTSDNYQVFSDADGVTVALKREGNVNDYVNVYVSTLSDTAKADEDYTPVMGDIMFLPGETEKKIYIPLLKDNIAEKDLEGGLYFEITAETEDNADIEEKRARIEILPFTNLNNEALVNVTDNSSKGNVRDSEDLSLEMYESSDQYERWGGNESYTMKKSVGLFKEGNCWYDGTRDLTGIERITFKWSNTGVDASSYNSRQVSTVSIGGKTKTSYKTFGEKNGEFSASDLSGIRKKDVYWKFNAYVSTDNSMNLKVWDIKRYYTKFNFLSRAPERLTAYIYTGTGKEDVASHWDFSPGSTVVSRDNFIKYDYIKADAVLSADGRDLGCSAQRVDFIGNDKTLSKTSGSYKYVDSDFIRDYIYNGNQNKSTLNAKAVFARTERVNKINIAPYENGVVKLGNTVVNDTTLTSDVWYKGDKLRFTITPNQGYHVANITANGKTYKYGEDITLANNMTVKVEFARDDNSVAVVHGKIAGYTESLDSNIKHGKVISPNLADSEHIGAMTRNQYEQSLSEDERNKVIIDAYQDYIEKNGFEDKFTNGIPLTYLYINKYDATGRDFDYKSRLKVDDYRKLTYYFATGGASEDIVTEGMNNAANALCMKLQSSDTRYLSALQIYFDFKSIMGSIGYCSATYNNESVSGFGYDNVVKKLCEAMAKDKFSHLTKNQATFVSNIVANGAYIDFFNDTHKNLFALSFATSVKVAEAEEAYDNYIDEAYKKYIQELNAKYNDKIDIKDLKDYSINNLTTGDTVNLLAQLEEGYTCVWLYNDSAKTIDESDQSIYTIHVGDSFSFAVRNNKASVKYFFVKVDDTLPDTIVHGRVIRPTKTLRTAGSQRVDINNNTTYQAVQGLDITVGTLETGISGKVNGKTYYPTTQTDANGYFNVLVPHGIEGFITNIIMANGEKTYVKDAVIFGAGESGDADKTIVFSLPYQDEKIWVSSFEFDCNESTKEGVYVEDKNITLESKLDVAEGYGVSQVVLRSYTLKGDLVKAWQMDPVGNGVYRSTFNAKEYLRDGGRLTIEPYDAYGRGVGQVESGCKFTEPPKPTQVGMPAMDELGGANLDTVGEFTPQLDMGDYTMTPEKTQYGETDEKKGEPFEIALLGGAMIQKEIKAVTEDGSKVFINGSAVERVSRLTAAIDPYSSNIILDGKKEGQNTWKKPEGMGKVGAKGGKLSHDVGLDLGFYIRLYKQHTDSGEVKYYYDQLYILAGLNINVKKDFQIFVGPVPCYITIKGGITLKGLIGMVPNPNVDTRISMDSGKLDADVLRKGGMDVAGLILIAPRFSLGAGVGVRGAFSVGVSGHVNVNIVYQPWSDGAGTVQFALKVDVDLGPIPLSFKVADITFGMFYTENYQKNSWLDFDKAVNKIDFDNYVKTLSVEDAEDVQGTMGKVSRGSGNNLEHSLRTFGDEDEGLKIFAEDNVRGTLKHPKPQLLHLGGQKHIIFYLGDDSARDDYDCQALYYSVFDGNTWSKAAKVDDDLTLDMDFNAIQEGDKVILAYSELNKQFGDTAPDMAEYLGSTNMNVCVFDEEGNKSSEKQLTKEDGYANNMPRIAYDKDNGRIFVAYLMTDYKDSRADFSYSQMSELGKFLNNSYGTVGYKMLDENLNDIGYSSNEVTYLAYEEHYGEGSLDAQRFVPLATDTISVNEMTASAYDGKVYMTYSVDMDGNSETAEDIELFASVVDIKNNSSVGPIRLTTNDVQDSNPQTVEYDNDVYIYWNRDGKIVYNDLEIAIGAQLTATDNGYTAGDMFYNVVQEGSEAAQTFRVSMEPNGVLYLTWNELDTNIEMVNDEEVPVSKRSIYMRTFDPHYSQESYADEETGETKYRYSGMWGAATAFDVPDNNMEMFNEQTFNVIDKDTALCAFRRFNWIEDAEGVKEAPNSDLIVRRYRVVSNLDIEKVTSTPEYPSPDEDAVISVIAKNAGVLPSEGVTFKAKLTDSQGNVTDLGEAVENTHLTASGEVEGRFTYRVPENGDSFKITITAYEENYSDNPTVFEKVFNKAPVIENIDPSIERTDNAIASITSLFLNLGNKASGEMTLKISAVNNGENAKTTELVNETLPSVEPGEFAEKDLDIDISECWGNGNMLRLFITLENADGILYSEVSDLNLISDSDLSVRDILINDGDESAIEVKAGEWAYPNFAITPTGASAGNKLVYSISDSSIADIDPSNGRVYGKKEGVATITVSAVSTKYSLFVNEDDNTYDSEGSLVLFDENGAVEAPANVEYDGKTVMTKQIQVKVTGTITETTTEAETETTTRARRSSGGGGGGSGRVATTTTVAENGTETTTEFVTEPTTQASNDTDTDIDVYTGFADVKGLWCEDIVNTLNKLGIVNGRTEDLFVPDGQLTRAELVQLLANLSGADIDSYKDSRGVFTDVPENAWYYEAVMWAADNDIVYGIGNDMFAPNRSVTREETAAIIYRYLKEEANEDISSFNDISTVSDYALEAVNTLTAQGIIKGYPDNTFRPKNSITRAEAASVIYGVTER